MRDHAKLSSPPNYHLNISTDPSCVPYRVQAAHSVAEGRSLGGKFLARLQSLSKPGPVKQHLSITTSLINRT